MTYWSGTCSADKQCIGVLSTSCYPDERLWWQPDGGVYNDFDTSETHAAPLSLGAELSI